MLDAKQTLVQLHAQRAVLDEAIEVMTRLANGGARKRGRPPGSKNRPAAKKGKKSNAEA